MPAFHARAGVLALGLLLASSGCNTAPPPTSAARGKHQYDNYCMPCHGEAGHGNPDIAAPSIAGLDEWYVKRQLDKYRSGVRGANYDDHEGFRMRSMSLALVSETAVQDVSAYVATMRASEPPPSLESGDATRGKALYATCTACHGAEGKGNEVLGAPPLTRTHDWYLLAQLKKFKYGSRAYDDRDTWGATMVPMAQALADEQDMKDVVAYIQTLRK